MKRLLLIDNAETSAGLWPSFFAEYGGSMTVARSGREGLGLMAKAGPFDLVLLELYLPGMDGIAVLDALQQSSPEVPVLALAEHRASGIDLLPAAVALGARKGLSKPLPTEILLREVAAILDWTPAQLERPLSQEVLR